jgi:hypothetical protein
MNPIIEQESPKPAQVPQAAAPSSQVALLEKISKIKADHADYLKGGNGLRPHTEMQDLMNDLETNAKNLAQGKGTTQAVQIFLNAAIAKAKALQSGKFESTDGKDAALAKAKTLEASLTEVQTSYGKLLGVPTPAAAQPVTKEGLLHTITQTKADHVNFLYGDGKLLRPHAEMRRLMTVLEMSASNLAEGKGTAEDVQAALKKSLSLAKTLQAGKFEGDNEDSKKAAIAEAKALEKNLLEMQKTFAPVLLNIAPAAPAQPEKGKKETGAIPPSLQEQAALVAQVTGLIFKDATPTDHERATYSLPGSLGGEKSV